MENINFKDKNDLERYIDIHKVRTLGLGLEGICYLLDNGYVIKVLYEKSNYNYLQFKDINNPSFVFPKYAGLVDDKIKALFMEYADGLNLVQHSPTEQKIVTIGKQLQVLVDNIKKISELGIVVKDFHCENVIYNNEGFRVIDTQSYTIEDKNSEIGNIKEIMTRIYGTFLYQIIRYEEIRKEFIDYGKLELLKNPEEYSKLLNDLICNLTQENIETVEEANKALRKKFKPIGVSRKNR